ncbi:MAG: 5-formyltetrahydrofolate cyclo-ligase, partial [Nitrospiraceae bacterium]|nr:5-formyltetrahydrofolate cyclo-ligase [Nitrospiraceae bacterium]
MSGEKDIIRQKILDMRNSLPAIEILKRSNKIIDRLHTMKDFASAKVVMPYISFGSEVNTHGLIRSLIGTKEVVVPVVADKEKREIILSELKDWKELSSGAYGILEPKKEFIRE